MHGIAEVFRRTTESGARKYLLRIPHTGGQMLLEHGTLSLAIVYANRLTQNAFQSASRAKGMIAFHVPCGTCGTPANPSEENCPECGGKIPLHTLNNVVILKHEDRRPG